MDAIDLIVAQAKRLQRESRILVQQVARLRDSMHDTAQEGTDDDRQDPHTR